MRAARARGLARGRGGGGKGRGKGGGGKGGGTSRAASLAQFESHFAAAYQKRWEPLKAALHAPVEHVAWINPFAAHDATIDAFDATRWRTYRHSSGCTMLVREGGGDGGDGGNGGDEGGGAGGGAWNE